MIGRIFLHRRGLERVAVLEGEYGLVLGAVVLVDAANIGEQRNSPDEQQEQDQADRAIDQIEHDLAAQRGIRIS